MSAAEEWFPRWDDEGDIIDYTVDHLVHGVGNPAAWRAGRVPLVIFNWDAIYDPEGPLPPNVAAFLDWLVDEEFQRWQRSTG